MALVDTANSATARDVLHSSRRLEPNEIKIWVALPASDAGRIEEVFALLGPTFSYASVAERLPIFLDFVMGGRSFYGHFLGLYRCP